VIVSIENGFANRVGDQTDTLIFERIIAAYNKAKVTQLAASEVYQVGNEWLPIYERHMGEVMEALSGENVPGLKRIYDNFFREPCSVGLHGMPVDMFQHYFSGNITAEYLQYYLNDSLHRIRLWLETMGKTCPVTALETPNVGNPYGYFIDGTFIRAGTDYQHYYATVIERLIRGSEHKTVLELGAGFGGMAYYLMANSADLTYIDIDLPENVALASFYLLSAFPDKNIALYGEIDLQRDDVNDYDAVLLPNFALPMLKTDSVDLVFNSYSLAEMSRETIETYIAQFNRIASKFIFHVNHNRVSVVKADEFAIDTEKFELLFRAPALWNMARNKEMDEFEYLYKNKRMVFAAPEAS
jgi:SAM-dependent methyltransferase